MKKTVFVVFSVLLLIISAFAFTSCSNGKDEEIGEESGITDKDNVGSYKEGW